MKILKQVALVRNIKRHDIDVFIRFLKEQKKLGATILQFHEVKDPHFDCGWISTSRLKSNAEMSIERKIEKPLERNKKIISKRILDIDKE